MKIFKNSLFTFILGAIIFGSITAYAISSRDISFTPKNENWKVDNLEDAINELYTNQDEKVTYLQNQVASINSGNCVSGTFVCTSCTTSSGQKILDFKPSLFLFYREISSSENNMWYYNAAISDTKWKTYNSDPHYAFESMSSRIKMEDSLIFYNVSSKNANKTFYYLACK